jgi:cytochrome P450
VDGGIEMTAEAVPVESRAKPDTGLRDLELRSCPGVVRPCQPVHWNAPLSAWIAESHADVNHVLSKPNYSADRLTAFYQRASEKDRATLSEVMRYISLWLVFRDPPEHTRLRRLMASAINPHSVETFRANTVDIAQFLIEKLGDKRDVEFMSEFAILLPAMVIMDMLGVPRDMLFQIKAWSDDMTNFVHSPRHVADRHERARKGVVAMAEFFRSMIDERRRKPTKDILSDLIVARDEHSKLSDDELVASAMLLLFAGHETTTNLIGNSMLTFALNPGQQRAFREAPQNVVPVVEELLRFSGSIRSTVRVVDTPDELGGNTLNKGDRVITMISTANRDPAIFADPNRLDFTRKPNPQIAFGRGPHFCIGAPLVRLEAQVALAALVQRYRSIELAVPLEDIRWLDSLISHSLEKLPLRLS